MLILWCKNGNFTFLPIATNTGRSTGRSTPTVESSSGEGWQFYISTITAITGRSSGQSTPY